MKLFLLLAILSGTILAQYTLPNFKATPLQLWQQLNYDTSKVELHDSLGPITVYSIAFSDREDSCGGGTFTFLNDTLYRATYSFFLRGDLATTFPLVYKKTKSYSFGHGNYYEKIVTPCGQLWINFTQDQVMSFVGLGNTYACRWPLLKNYSLATNTQYDVEYSAITYAVSFLSEKAYIEEYGTK
ncbi:MAG: hypothetical protein LC102_11675 [Ignavibacteriales bacterium]|nr:hypothetical protein [Ignavibacteriales bacterium]